MKLDIVESPLNPSRLWVVDQDNPGEPYPGTGCYYLYQFTRPLKLWAHDADYRLVVALKLVSGQLNGFGSLAEVRSAIDTVQDVDALALSLGTSINSILELPE